MTMKKTMLVNRTYQLPVIIRRDGEGFLATSPIWKDCYAQGDTVDEATAETIAVAAALIELYQEEGKPIPLKIARRTRPSGYFRFKLPVVVPAAS